MLPFFLLLLTLVSGSSLSSNENKGAKIVGGRPVPEGQYPWELSVGLARTQAATRAQREQQPALYKEQTHHCDGVLLNSTMVMTAGHCGVNPATNQPYAPSELLVGFPSKDLDQVYVHGRLPVDLVIVKPGHVHGKSTSMNDITLLRLAKPLIQGQGAFACLPKPNPTPVHYQGTLTSIGFGNVHALYYDLSGSKIVGGIQPSRYLKEIDVEDITNQATTNDHAKYCRGRTDLICITAIQDEESTCQGDSGGSLVYQGQLVIGITSFGETKNYDSTRSITCIGDTSYTRLAYHASWIQSIVPSVCLR